MGWAFNNCSTKNQNSINHLVIEYSSQGAPSVSSFVQFLRLKTLNAKISTLSNGNKNDLINIKYYTCNRMVLIYEGNNLEEKDFDSLYSKIISS